MLQMTNDNFPRLLRGLTIAVGSRKNRILLYQFLSAEIRALHCSYGIGDGESFNRAPRSPGGAGGAARTLQLLAQILEDLGGALERPAAGRSAA